MSPDRDDSAPAPASRASAAGPVVPLSERRYEDEPHHGARMSLGAHVEELRARLVIALAAFGVVFVAGLAAYQWLWWLVRLPLEWTAASMGESAEKLVTFKWDGPMDGFLAIVKVDLAVAVALSLPVWTYQAWAFVAPGLTRREKRALVWILTAGTVLFAAGCALAFLYAAPLGMRFLLWFNRSLEGTVDLWTAERYLGFVIMAALGFGIACETPLVMAALARAGLITPAGILRYWRHTALGAAVVGAVLTPPDPLTQVLMAGLLVGLYFAGYLLARWQAGKTG